MDPSLSNESGHTDATLRQFPLLDLPPELRNIIYRAVLVDDDPISIDGTKPLTRMAHHMRILHACSQIHREAHDLLWSENIFSIELYGDGTCGPLSWRKEIGKAKAWLIKNLRLGVSDLVGNRILHQIAVTATSFTLTNFDDTVHSVLRHGVPISSIQIMEPPLLTSSASIPQRLNAKVKQVFHGRASRLLQKGKELEEGTVPEFEKEGHQDAVLQSTLRSLSLASYFYLEL